MVAEAVKTSAIEGEFLSHEDVLSSIQIPEKCKNLLGSSMLQNLLKSQPLSMPQFAQRSLLFILKRSILSKMATVEWEGHYTKKALSQGLRRPILLSLSRVIETKPQDFYNALKKAQSSNEITPSIAYF